jgi:hypothetical protein
MPFLSPRRRPFQEISKKLTFVILSVCLVFACSGMPTFAQAEDVSETAPTFRDDFNAPELADGWRRLFKVEDWPNDPWESARPGEGDGWLAIVPRANAWYQDYRGGLLFREVTGDFDVTTRVQVTGRDGRARPRAAFSLAGLAVRAPRDVTPQSWQPGGENLVFLALGVGDPPDRWQFQSMDTRTSHSEIVRADAASGEAQLRIVRRGGTLRLLRRQAEEWVEHATLDRPDLPETLQVGLMAATDWNTCQQAGVATHNRDGVRGGQPDLLARFDYVELATAPAELANTNTPSTNTNPTRKRGTSSASPTDLSTLSDDFDDAETLKSWKRVFEVEQTGADQLQRIDIGQTREGWMVMQPYTSSWYRDHRGVLVHKDVTGDFIVTTRVRTERRGGNGAPRRQFSLAGIMIRTPRDVTPRTWWPGGENYIFLSHGAADRPGTYQMEVKTTINSDSQLQISPAPGNEVEIRAARLGQHFILLMRRPGAAWTVHRRYHRPDMPATLQVGMTVYTDWPNVERTTAEVHNRTVIRNGQPDLVAGFDYFRFRRPDVPQALAGRDLSNASAASDADLLRFLGAAADE